MASELNTAFKNVAVKAKLRQLKVEPELTNPIAAGREITFKRYFLKAAAEINVWALC